MLGNQGGDDSENRILFLGTPADPHFPELPWKEDFSVSIRPGFQREVMPFHICLPTSPEGLQLILCSEFIHHTKPFREAPRFCLGHLPIAPWNLSHAIPRAGFNARLGTNQERALHGGNSGWKHPDSPSPRLWTCC